MEGRADIYGGMCLCLWRGGLIFREGRADIAGGGGGKADISGGEG